ncbi:unnamed protein product [Chironomus riparius]|uniref:Ionotropic receptor n=1 Tax=Chironomus riparius TaxID=315576 RepID=A0A9N9WW28_9DIPT|nr:unnamed protein product [Chironomus riparius]
MDILDSFFKIYNGIFAYRVRFHEAYLERFTVFRQSFILFLEEISDFKYVEEHYKIVRYHNQPMTFLILIPNLTFAALKSSWIYQFYERINAFSAGVFHHSFFITNEIDTVTLSTVEWFTPSGCNTPFLTKLNTFKKDLMTWHSELKSYEKFIEYFGCELVLGLPIVEQAVLHHVSGFSLINEKLHKVETHGIIPVVFNIAANLHNFTDAYQPIIMHDYNMEEFGDSYFDLVSIENETAKTPSVYFQIEPLNSLKYHKDISHTVTDLKIYMLVTPGEKYTQYQKFILPFDQQTWIFVGITFSVTFLTIFVVNCLSKPTQNIVYGHKIENPFWNVISIFFGIAQTRLPDRNFSSKFFEFMTTEPRFLPPKTIQDVVERKYQVYALDVHLYYSREINRLEKWPNVLPISTKKFYEIFLTQSQNASSKTALCVDDFLLNFVANFTKSNHDWIQLKQSILYTTHEAFVFLGPSFYYRMFKKLIDSLISTGVMKYLIENFYTKDRIFKRSKGGPKILTIPDLMFGFNIWIGFCFISFSLFLGEQLARYVEKRTKPVKIVQHRIVVVKRLHSTIVKNVIDNQENEIISTPNLRTENMQNLTCKSPEKVKAFKESLDKESNQDSNEIFNFESQNDNLDEMLLQDIETY